MIDTPSLQKKVKSLYRQVALKEKIKNIKKFEQELINIELEFINKRDKRKKEGAYYTGDEITEFIIKNALEEYFTKAIDEKNLKISNFSNVSDLVNGEMDYGKQIYGDRFNIHICDPACGSGIFLLKYLDITSEFLKRGKNSREIEYSLLSLLKRIHGFDINEIAVKLSILKIIRWVFENFGIISSKINSILIKNIQKENILINQANSKYDLIVGNPPYGNILSEKEKHILKTQNIYNKDIYCAFILKVLEFNPSIVGFLVPKSFLLRESYLSFRTRLLSETNLLRIYDIGSNQFKSATNEVAIIIYEKKNNNRLNSLKVFNYPGKFIRNYSNQKVDDLMVCLNKKCPLRNSAKKFSVYTSQKECPHCKTKTIDLNRIRIKPNKEIFQLINKVEDISDLNFLNIRDYPQMKRGEEDVGLREVKKKLMNNLQGSCYFVDAKQDFQYYHLNPKKSFNIEEINEDVLKGKNYEFYIKPKLLIKHNNIVPEAIYTEDKYCFTSSIYSLLSSDSEMLKFLCAIMNSALIQFYCLYAINNQKSTTINLNQYMIRHLPIKKPNKTIINTVKVQVDDIIAYLKTRNGIFDNRAYLMFKEIDQKIFNFYGLNQDEQNLIIEDVRKNISFFSGVYI